MLHKTWFIERQSYHGILFTSVTAGLKDVRSSMSCSDLDLKQSTSQAPITFGPRSSTSCRGMYDTLLTMVKWLVSMLYLERMSSELKPQNMWSQVIFIISPLVLLNTWEQLHQCRRAVDPTYCLLVLITTPNTEPILPPSNYQSTYRNTAMDFTLDIWLNSQLNCGVD